MSDSQPDWADEIARGTGEAVYGDHHNENSLLNREIAQALRDERAETIERCAKRVEDIFEDYVWRKEVAVAIREQAGD